MSREKKGKKVRTSITLPEETLDDLRKRAEANQRTVSQQIVYDVERQADSEAERKQGK